MHTLEGSIDLAKAMVDIGTLADKPVVAIVTGMEQPLGTHVGNALEVKDAIDVLSGRTAGALKEVSLLLGSHMLVLAGRAKTTTEGKALLEEAIRSGAGLQKLREIIAAQGGDPNVCDDLSLLPQAKVVKTYAWDAEGYVEDMDTTAIGLAAQALGAGRMKKSDVLDYSVGLVLHARIGDKVEKGMPLVTIYAKDEAAADTAAAKVRQVIKLSTAPVQQPPLWYAIVTKDGVQRFDR